MEPWTTLLQTAKFHTNVSDDAALSDIDDVASGPCDAVHISTHRLSVDTRKSAHTDYNRLNE